MVAADDEDLISFKPWRLSCFPAPATINKLPFISQ